MFGRIGGFLGSALGRASVKFLCIEMWGNARAKAAPFVGGGLSSRKRSGRLFLRRFVLILFVRVAIAESFRRNVCF